jgi:eukaryotic-like serine/threonine-protein kinase
MLLPEGYTEIGVVEEGSSGPITVARPPRGGAPVAMVLVPRPYDPTLPARLSALKALRHRSIAGLRDWTETEEGLVLVGELVDGVPLRALLDSTGLLPVEAALVVLRDSLLGAATANDAGLPRGDHRPETVMLTRRGEVRLLEVGLTTVARPPYLAPEVWEGGPATPASDVYAATAVLVECLGGGPPYGAGDDLGGLRARHLHAPIPIERVPEALRSLVRHGLDKDPHERCAEARLLLLELAAVAGGALGSGWERHGREQLAAAVRPLEFLFPPPRLLGAAHAGAGGAAERRDRRRAAAAIAAAAALLAVVGGSLAFRHGGSPTGPVTGIGGGQTSDLAPLTIPGATPTPTPTPSPSPTPTPTTQPAPTPGPSPTPAPATPAPTAVPAPTARLLPTVSAAPSATPTATPGPLTATGVRKLAFQHCSPGAGGFVCPFTVTFDWDDPGGTGGSIAWHLAGNVFSQTTGCARAVAFSVAETTSVPQEQPGAHTASISGNLTVSADPAGPAAQNPSKAKASLDASGASVGPVPFYGGSTC